MATLVPPRYAYAPQSYLNISFALALGFQTMVHALNSSR